MKTLLVLAAGMGSRFGGLKQMEPVGPSGEVLLDYSIYDAVRAGFERVVFVIRRDFEAEFRAKVGSRYEAKLAVDYAFQELEDLPGGFVVPAERTKPWGTGHAIWAARGAIEGPFATVNADDFYGSGAFAALEVFFRNRWQPGKAALVAYQLSQTISEHGAVSRGICTATNGALQTVEEYTEIRRGEAGSLMGLDGDGGERRLNGGEWVSMNLWCFGPEIFAELERLFSRFLAEGGLLRSKSEFYIPTVVTDLIAEGRLGVTQLETWDRWFGVTYREDRAVVETALAQLVRQGLYPAHLLNS